MSIEDHHRFEQWSTALDDLKDAKDRFVQARAARDPELETHRAEFIDALVVYSKIVTEME